MDSELTGNRYEHLIGTKLVAVSPKYFEAINDGTASCHFSSGRQVAAAANVIKRDIVSINPRITGTLDSAANMLDITFHAEEKITQKFVYIMWTNVNPPKKDYTWTANYFVPLID